MATFESDESSSDENDNNQKWNITHLDWNQRRQNVYNWLGNI